MTLGERCDEIVRIIDETLLTCASVPVAAPRVESRPAERYEDEYLARTA